MQLKTFLLSFVFPQKLAEVESSINGQIKVTKFFGQNRIEAGGLTQSGEYVEDLLGRALQSLDNQIDKKPDSILILGLGGGSVIKRINQLWPKAQIVGVEIDPLMIELGEKYLSLREARNLAVITDDAIVYVKKKVGRQSFDLILIDLILGYEYPKEAEKKKFLKNLKKLLDKNGTVIVNRLYFKKYKKLTDKFVEKLKTVFDEVTFKKFYSNLLIFARHK